MDPSGPPRPREAESLFQKLVPAVVSASDHHRSRFRAFAVGAVAIAIVVAFAGADGAGLAFGLVIAAVLGARALYHLWRARRAAPGDQMVTRIDGLPEAERPAAYRRVMWVGGAAFAALSAWTAFRLHQLETGAEREVEVWGPIAFLYEHLGFWPAALALPALGLLVVFEAWRKGRQGGGAGGRLVR